MAIGTNKVVSVNYILKDNEGVIIDSTENSLPFAFISGSEQILPKLEEEVSGMIIGSRKNIKLTASEAYGEYDHKAVQNAKRSQFPEDFNLEVGMNYVANSPDGKQMPFIITEIKDDDITIDFNHPLAGKELEYEIVLNKIVEKPEEKVSAVFAYYSNADAKSVSIDSAKGSAKITIPSGKEIPQQVKKKISDEITKNVAGIKEVSFIENFDGEEPSKASSETR